MIGAPIEWPACNVSLALTVAPAGAWLAVPVDVAQRARGECWHERFRTALATNSAPLSDRISSRIPRGMTKSGFYLKMQAAPFCRDTAIPKFAQDDTILAFFDCVAEAVFACR